MSGKQLQFVNLGKDGIASLTDCEDLRQVTTVPGYFALDKDRVQLVDQPVFFQTALRTKTGSVKPAKLGHATRYAESSEGVLRTPSWSSTCTVSLSSGSTVQFG